MEQKQDTFIEALNNYSIEILVTVSGFFVYLFSKISKPAASYIYKAVQDKRDNEICEKVMSKYTPLVREQAKQIAEENIAKLETAVFRAIKDIKVDIKDIKDNMKTEKQRNHDAIAKNEGVLMSVLDVIEKYDKKLDEKTIINIPTNKPSSTSRS